MSDTSAVELIATIMSASAATTSKISNDLIARYRGDYDAVYNGVRAALDSIPQGGTTAEYERGLRLIERALTPPREVRDFYVDRAERSSKGDHDDRLHPWHYGKGVGSL